jgi:ABC-type dipeptide/oligopeptide/nickel transport system ATPase subunit
LLFFIALEKGYFKEVGLGVEGERWWATSPHPLRRSGMKETDVQTRTQELVKSFNIKFDLQRYPYNLSGGQQQTVCIMRAFSFTSK